MFTRLNDLVHGYRVASEKNFAVHLAESTDKDERANTIIMNGAPIYTGVTNDLVRRVYEHKNGLVPGHSKRYRIDKLVYFETYDSIYQTIQREKNMKHWPRLEDAPDRTKQRRMA